MNNQPMHPKDIPYTIRKIDRRPSDEELAKLIIQEEASLYGVRAKPWSDIDGIEKEFYIRVARLVLNSFYHPMISSYPDGAPTKQGYQICYVCDGTSYGITESKVCEVLREEFPYIESYSILSQAITKALYRQE